MIEVRENLSTFRDMYRSNGLYLLRVATQLNINNENEAIQLIKDSMKAEVQANPLLDDTDRAKKNNVIDTLDEAKILHVKKIVKETEEYGLINYYQIVVKVRVFDNLKGIDNVLNSLPRIINDDKYTAMVGRFNVQGLMYQLLNLNCYASKATTVFSDTEFGRFAVEQVLNIKDDLAVGVHSDVTKKYNGNNIIKLEYEIYDNIIVGFNNKSSNMLAICNGTSAPSMVFYNLISKMNGDIVFVRSTENKLKMDIYKDMIVIYDGIKTYEHIKPILRAFASYGTNILEIYQFTRRINMITYTYKRPLYRYTSTAKVRYVNVDKIIYNRSFHRDNIKGVHTMVACKPKKDESGIIYDVMIKQSSPDRVDVVIPVGKNNEQDKALDAVGMLLTASCTSDDYQDYIEAYYNSFTLGFNNKDAVPESDLLNEWFKSCTEKSKKDNNDIVKAYEKMEKGLMTEYNENKKYLSYYDFSKCTPIPKIEASEKMLKNYYKSLHMQPKHIIINKINNLEIDKIERVVPMIKFMCVSQQNIYTQEKELRDYVDTKSNVIRFDYNKMKGEAKNAKVENWR